VIFTGFKVRCNFFFLGVCLSALVDKDMSGVITWYQGNIEGKRSV